MATLEEVMGTMMQWATATEALAALGAELTLLQADGDAPPEIVDALRAVTSAAGLPDLSELPAPQRAAMLGMVRLFVHSAVDLVDDAGRAPGWTFTDTAILDGWGRGSTMVAPMIAAAHPDLQQVRTFLDVGTGVGLLAVAATQVWPDATVVGIDPWEPSLARARTNVSGAGLDDRITLRDQALTSLDEVDVYDCAWIPTFFVGESELEKGVPVALRALQPGGWVVLGVNRTPPIPLAQATATLRVVRGGGTALTTERAIELLEEAGYDGVHAVVPPGPAPMELVLGQRPA